MAVKIEWILTLVIVVILAFAYDFKVKNKSIHQQSTVSKNLEFYDISFTKVDTYDVLSVVDTTYGVLYGSVLNAYHIIYKDEHIDKLSAQKGIFVDNYLYLEGNISVYQKDNFSCFTQNAIYDKKLSILSVPKEFIVKLNGSTIKGKKLLYDIQTKLLKASHIEASLEF